MNKQVLLTLLSVFLVACSSNTPPENKNLIPISQYLDLTTKDGKKVPLNKQRMLFHKYWKVQLFGETYFRNRPKKSQSGCVRVLVAINEEGKMSSYKIQKSYPKGLFDEYIIVALKTRNWKPTETNIDRTPVLTTLQINLIHSTSSNRSEASKECEMRR